MRSSTTTSYAVCLAAHNPSVPEKARSTANPSMCNACRIVRARTSSSSTSSTRM
jgi:hypothetical protein